MIIVSLVTSDHPRYQHGLPSGLCWQLLPGGGLLHGQLDTGGQLSGPALTFLYPDMITALQGTFLRGRMVAAVSAKVKRRVDTYIVCRLEIRLG